MHAGRYGFALLVCLGVFSPRAAFAQSGGATLTLDGTLTFEGTLTLTIPPGYEALPEPVPSAPPATVLPPPAVILPPAAVVPPPPVLEVLPASTPQMLVPPVVPVASDVAAAPRMRRRWGLVVPGALMLAGGYGLGLGMGLSSSRSSAWPLVPFAGALVQIGQDNDLGRLPFYLLSSGLQIAGFIMAVVGTATRRPVRERDAAHVSVVPVVSDSITGAVVSGSF